MRSPPFFAKLTLLGPFLMSFLILILFQYFHMERLNYLKAAVQYVMIIKKTVLTPRCHIKLRDIEESGSAVSMTLRSQYDI